MAVSIRGFHYAVAFFALLEHRGIVSSYLLAIPISIVALIFARRRPKGQMYWLTWSWFGLLFGGWGETLICLVLAVEAAILHRWDIAIYLGLAAFGFTALFEAPTWLWGIGAQRIRGGRYMSPKYVIAKRLFGMRFPFEAAF